MPPPFSMGANSITQSFSPVRKMVSVKPFLLYYGPGYGHLCHTDTFPVEKNTSFFSLDHFRFQKTKPQVHNYVLVGKNFEITCSRET